MSNKAKKISISFIAVLFSFILIELFLRSITFYISPEKKILFSFDPVATSSSPRKSVYQMVVDKDLFWKRPEVTTKDLEFKEPGMIRIICIGDSTTAGYHLLPKGCSFPEQMEKILRAKYGNRIEVKNFGVGGYTSYQGLVFLKKYILSYKPDVIIVKFGANDSSQALPLPDKEVKVSSGAERMDKLFRWSRIYQLIWFLKTIRINKYYFQHERELPRRVSLEDFKKNLSSIVDISSRHNIDVVFVTTPTLDPQALVLKYNQTTREVSRFKNVPLADMAKEFEKIKGDKENLFYTVGHLKCEGEKIVANRLADIVSKIVSQRLNDIQI